MSLTAPCGTPAGSQGWTSPFVWFEYPDGRRDAKGGSERFRKWAKATFDDKGKGEHINALTSRSPSQLLDLFYDIAPGSASPEGPEGGTYHSRAFASGLVLLAAAVDVHFRGIPMVAKSPEEDDEMANTVIDPIEGVMYKRRDANWDADNVKVVLAACSAVCILLSIVLWWFYWIPLPTEEDAKALSGSDRKDDKEAETKRRIRNAIRMEERLKRMQQHRLIRQVVEGDSTLIGNPRTRDTLLRQETAAFKAQQRAARKKRRAEKAAALESE